MENKNSTRILEKNDFTEVYMYIIKIRYRYGSLKIIMEDKIDDNVAKRHSTNQFERPL